MSLADTVEYVAACATAAYVDGTPFFDWLDDRLGKEHFLRGLMDDVYKDYGYVPPIVVTGKFGEKYRKWLEYYMGKHWTTQNLVVMPGDLRHIEVPPDSEKPRADLDYVFLDNSIYKGRTLRKTIDWITSHHAAIKDARVLYDGTLPPHNVVEFCQVKYYYRWHKDGIRVAEKRKPSSSRGASLPTLSQAAV